jgi:acetyltransferase-like isoleucine patch superfamily enzyme
MIINKLIWKIKGNSNYEFQTKLSLSELRIVLINRAIQIIRGFSYKPILNYKGILFLGRNISIKHKSKILFGKNCIIGNNVFINALSENGIKIGDNVTISQNSILICTGVIRNKGVGLIIGNNVGINARAFISAQGGITIGDDVIIGPDVRLIAENHIFESTKIPIRLQGERRQGITIGKDCWIGSNVTILDGVNLGKGCVIAAGAVVNNSFPENTVIGGVPAKIIKIRK